jgi:hypothetical protein
MRRNEKADLAKTAESPRHSIHCTLARATTRCCDTANEFLRFTSHGHRRLEHASSRVPEGATTAPTFECRWTETPPIIDGHADEATWMDASVVANFAVPWVAGAPLAKEQTRVRLLWDREWLYFAAEMDDADVTAVVREHDGRLWENDVFELFFRPSQNTPVTSSSR